MKLFVIDSSQNYFKNNHLALNNHLAFDVERFTFYLVKVNSRSL